MWDMFLLLNTTHLPGQVQHVRDGDPQRRKTAHKDASKFHNMRAGDDGIGACESMMLTFGSRLKDPVRFC